MTNKPTNQPTDQAIVEQYGEEIRDLAPDMVAALLKVTTPPPTHPFTLYSFLFLYALHISLAPDMVAALLKVTTPHPFTPLPSTPSSFSMPYIST